MSAAAARLDTRHFGDSIGCTDGCPGLPTEAPRRTAPAGLPGGALAATWSRNVREGRHTGFGGAILAFFKRLGLPRAVEWAVILWMYLWIIGFVVAVAIATVRGYVRVVREVRSFEVAIERLVHQGPYL